MIPLTFSIHGIPRKLIEHNDKWAIYGLPGSQGYELHKLRYRQGKVIQRGTSTIVLKEGFYLASTNEFGRYAWHIMDYHLCYRMLESLKFV